MRLLGGIGFVLLAVTGCGDGASAGTVATRTPVPALASHFDAKTVGTIAGRVRWSGDVPTVEPIRVQRFTGVGYDSEIVFRPNPHAPAIDSTGRYSGAVIYLRGVDPTKARSWDHPPVSIEMHDERPIVRQGDMPPRLVGFVRRGDSITAVSKQTMYHTLRARQAAFFTLTLPQPDKPRKRAINDRGWVELSNGSGQMAMRGHLFVDDHPYYTLTDADGKFRLTQVPKGKYELVCWRPDWRIERWEHDPETLLNIRVYFKPPQETIIPVTVNTGETAEIMLEVGP